MMHSFGYDIKIYHPNYMPQVVELLTYLLGDNHEQNQSYFQWKYHDNPYSENPMCVVALHKGKVVGFRGYFVTKWQIRAENYCFTVLSPADACVHPDHRRKKLALLMGEKATDEFTSKCKLFFNFSVSKITVPINLRLGYRPITDRAYLNKGHLLGLIKFILTLNDRKELQDGKIKFGDFGNIVVSDSPKPREMSAIVNKQNTFDRRITPLQNEEYFRWRFCNNRYKYVFYFYRREKITTGYVVIKVSDNNRRGYIVDFSTDNSATLEKILDVIIKSKAYDILSISNYSLTVSESQILKKFHFKTNSLIQLLEKTMKGDVSLLIRPVLRDFSEIDFFIRSLDIRKKESWDLKEICSDGV